MAKLKYEECSRLLTDAQLTAEELILLTLELCERMDPDQRSLLLFRLDERWKGEVTQNAKRTKGEHAEAES